MGVVEVLVLTACISVLLLVFWLLAGDTSLLLLLVVFWLFWLLLLLLLLLDSNIDCGFFGLLSRCWGLMVVLLWGRSRSGG